MSIIPKISVGQNKRRNKLSLNQDCSTTANVGQIQPTYSKELIPNETIKLSVNSFVRLSPLAVPTFGRMSLRHYHFFVPYMKIFDRFNAFLSQMSVSTPNGNQVPTILPFFNDQDVAKIIYNFSDVSFYRRPTTVNPADTIEQSCTLVSSSDSDFNTILSDFLNEGKFESSSFEDFNSGVFTPSASLKPDHMGGIITDEDIYFVDASHRDPSVAIPTISNRNSDGQPFYSVVGFDGCDFSIAFGTAVNGMRPYVALFRLKPIAKRLRTFFIGLGYSFTPFQDPNCRYNPFKLMAAYMAYFAIFAPKREKGFETTACYKLMQFFHDLTYQSSDTSTSSYWYEFIMELAQMAYHLPMDYFSASTALAGQSFSSESINLFSMSSLDGDSYDVAAAIDSSSNSSVLHSATSNLPTILSTNLAERLLTWVNKSTIVGRSISDFIKAHFGVEAPDVTEINGVQYVGSSRVNIQINDIMSTAETSEGFLGEYAGRGIGVDNSKQFEYTAKEFGVFLTLSCIVPESGYVQGYLKENRQLNRFDFPTPEFDALGYELVERGEIMNSYASNLSLDLDPSYSAYKRTQGFGFIPRYSHHKVGRNILNGDLSLPSLFNSMGNYTLDRIFPFAPNYSGNQYFGYQELYQPDVVHDDFRKVTLSDKFGNYNRIFNYTGIDVDHFIIHNVFYVDVLSPLKSLSSSFDTFTEGDDTDVNMKKQ